MAVTRIILYGNYVPDNCGMRGYSGLDMDNLVGLVKFVSERPLLS